MKIKKIYVENFGVLHDFTLDILDNLTQIYHENGWGKSTLNAFIKAMLYGLPAKSRGEEYKYERSKYMPWQGGNYGGFMEYEENDEHYRVTRYFGKTPQEDRYELLNLDTNKVEKIEKEPLGEQIFNVGCDSFVMSAFFSQLDFKCDVTPDMSASLTGTNRFQDDLNKVQSAIKALKDQKNYIKRQQLKREELEFKKAKLHQLEASLNQIKIEIITHDKDMSLAQKELNTLTSLIEEEKKKLDGYNQNLLLKEKTNEQLIESNEKIKNLNDRYISLLKESTKNQKINKKGIFAIAGCVFCVLCMIVMICLGVLKIAPWWLSGIIIVISAGLTILFVAIFKKFYNKSKKVFKEELDGLSQQISIANDENKTLLKVLENQSNAIMRDSSQLEKLLDSQKQQELKIADIDFSKKSLLQKQDYLCDEIENLQNDIEVSTQKSTIDEQRILLLEKTALYLQKAYDNVLQRFLGDINKDFTLILDEFHIGKEIIMDSKFKLSQKLPQGTKTIEFSSQGIQDIIYFCQRISLVEKIYKKCKPPIFLDDIFVNLDDNMLKLAKKIVKNLSEKYQVFYFCCNSRCQIIKTM